MGLPAALRSSESSLGYAKAQLAAAEASARVAENEATYSILVADADGTVVETLGEPGQVVAAGHRAGASPLLVAVSLPDCAP